MVKIVMISQLTKQASVLVIKSKMTRLVRLYRISYHKIRVAISVVIIISTMVQKCKEKAIFINFMENFTLFLRNVRTILHSEEVIV